MTSPSETPGTANIDFVVFCDRWLVAENTFRPPWYHMNVMSEFMGLIYGSYDAKTGGGFVPGGCSLHNTMLPHGPDRDAFEGASKAELKPHKLEGTMAFMFETRFPQRVTAYAAGIPQLQKDYGDYGQELKKHFDPSRPRAAVVTDATHDPSRRSWVASAEGHPDFPIQNLPLGVFSPPGGTPAGGVAIGDMILDLPALLATGLLEGEARKAAEAAAGPTLNALLALGAGPRRALRARLVELLTHGSPEQGQGRAAAAPGRRLHDAPAGQRSATTPTSMSASTTPPMSASCSAPTTRCCRTTSGCRSAITAGPRPSCRRARPCAARTASASAPTRRSPASAPAATWTTSSSSGSGSAPATSRAARSRSAKRRSTWPATAC